MITIMTDDPVRDFERYDAEMARAQEEYDRKCIHCAFCGEAIRPYEDPRCYQLYQEEAIHPECLKDMFRSMEKRFKNSRLYADLFDAMEEAFEELSDITTPEPVEGGYY